MIHKRPLNLAEYPCMPTRIHGAYTAYTPGRIYDFRKDEGTYSNLFVFRKGTFSILTNWSQLGA